mgnify:CR=1 FL=1
MFHGTGHGPVSRFLAPGFRHCFVCVQDANGVWIRIDGQAGLPNIRAECGAGFDLAGFYRTQGLVVVECTDIDRRTPRSPLMLGTCVGAAKRILGLRAPFVLTPYQLYRRLVRP